MSRRLLELAHVKFEDMSKNLKPWIVSPEVYLATHLIQHKPDPKDFWNKNPNTGIESIYDNIQTQAKETSILGL